MVRAFLLFLVQSVISKRILPLYGGSPAVGTTCMLFFQTIPLGGSACAHLLGVRCEIKWPLRWHGSLTLAAQGRESDRFGYNDIDPRAVKPCRKQFTCLAESRAKVDVILSSGDAVPVRIANKHLDLTPFVVRGAEERYAQSVFIEYDENGNEIEDVDSGWILVTNNPAVLGQPDIVRTGPLQQSVASAAMTSGLTSRADPRI